MATTPEMFMKIEKRLLVVEQALGIVPDKEDLLHPKALSQFNAIEEAKIALEKGVKT